MIDGITSERKRTRAEQRADTRRTILDAAVESLVADGLRGMTTRRVAERAGVAQSTLMHHFAAREALLVEAVEHLALRLAEEALDQIDLAALRRPELREAVLDQAWREFTSPQALAAAQLWIAAWDEPELAVAVHELEQRLGGIITATAGAMFPEQAEDASFPALIDVTVSLIRGLVMGIPISGPAAVDARWEAMKPILLRAAADLLDG